MTLSTLCLAGFAQKAVTGRVTDAAGEPLIGVSVVVKGTSQGGVTDLDGNFTIPNASPSTTLQFSYVGYKTKDLKVGSNGTLTVVLDEDNQALDEVVVVGYGTMKKSDLTGSVASVSSEKVAARGTTSVAESLQGSVPGVSITQSSSRAGGGISM